MTVYNHRQKLIFKDKKSSVSILPHMVWPSMSPDLNPTEHVWDQLKHRLNDRTPPHVMLPQNNIMRLVRSMRRRCQAVIAANGGNTRY
uniref:Tc1-like transposase DDE domain-containing protein n=1 Tax=Paramormyrops kingsleyae TaxID=1676925 RepID=A0A3B3RGY2_9TELE